MPAPRLVGVGASAGGVEALLEIVVGLGPVLEEHDAAVLLVLHQPARSSTVLPSLLGRHCTAPVAHAEHGTAPRAGRVHVAPPDRHLLVVDGVIVLSAAPAENGHRPAVDPLLRSLAAEAGPAAVGVILSGMLRDGAAGLREVVRRGGSALVQDPEDAHHAGMPRAALAAVPDAPVHTAATLAAALGEVLGRTRTADAHDTKGGR